MLERIEIYHCSIPFKIGYDHAKASRLCSDSLLVRCTFTDGVYYGECAPRWYVTKESADTVIEVIERKKDLIKRTENSLEGILQLGKEWGDTNLSAFSAIEGALLQRLAGRNNLQNLLDVQNKSLEYSATITGGGWESFQKMVIGFHKNQMTDVKIKLLTNNHENLRRIQFIYEVYEGNVRIRVDGNELWQFDENKQDIKQLIDAEILEFEQLFSKEDRTSCKRFMQEFGNSAQLILDDSITSWESYCAHRDLGLMHGVNLKISKHGGYFKSLAIAEDCLSNGLSVQLGAHVGETSLLAYFGALLGMKIGGQLKHAEGAFSTHLLEFDPVSPAVQFGFKGKLASLPNLLNVEEPRPLLTSVKF